VRYDGRSRCHGLDAVELLAQVFVALPVETVWIYWDNGLGRVLVQRAQKRLHPRDLHLCLSQDRGWVAVFQHRRLLAADVEELDRAVALGLLVDRAL
jgi:hypothetical protein